MVCWKLVGRAQVAACRRITGGLLPISRHGGSFSLSLPIDDVFPVRSTMVDAIEKRADLVSWVTLKPGSVRGAVWLIASALNSNCRASILPGDLLDHAVEHLLPDVDISDAKSR